MLPTLSHVNWSYKRVSQILLSASLYRLHFFVEGERDIYANSRRSTLSGHNNWFVAGSQLNGPGYRSRWRSEMCSFY